MLHTETYFRDDRFPDIQIRWKCGALFDVCSKRAITHNHDENGWATIDYFTRSGSAPNQLPTMEEAQINAQAWYDTR